MAGSSLWFPQNLASRLYLTGLHFSYASARLCLLLFHWDMFKWLVMASRDSRVGADEEKREYADDSMARALIYMP